jgi:hypothetical protein
MPCARASNCPRLDATIYSGVTGRAGVNEPDWLLIYRTTATEVLLARTGTHADLFDK